MRDRVQVDCPSCDSLGTLEIEPMRTYSLLPTAICSCCSKRCVLDQKGRAVPVVERDMTGAIVDGP